MYKAWLTEAEKTEKDKTEIVRLEAFVSGPKCFSRAIRAAEIPLNFRLAAGVSTFTGESKLDTWLEEWQCKLVEEMTKWP